MTTRREFLSQATAGVIAAAAWLRIAPVPKAAAGEHAPKAAQPGIVETVLGPLDASKLGFTLPHEHITDATYYLNKWPKAWASREEFVARAVEKLKVIRAAGVNTLVDLSPYDEAARDIRFLEEVSRKCGLNMIACTGQRFFPPISHVSMPSRTIEGLAKFFKTEIQRGIDGTTIKAGVIKIGIIKNIVTPLEEVGLRAAVRASKATGVPIRIHTDAPNRAGESIAVILEHEGMNPTRVSFDHSDDSGDMDYFLGLVRRGYSLGMDHVHRGLMPDFKPSFAMRAECIRLLIDAGFAQQIFFSTDSELGGSLLPDDKKEWRDKLDAPDGMLFAVRKLIPYLKGLGVSNQAIRTITVDNPARFFVRS